jgi:hypothetical protein
LQILLVLMSTFARVETDVVLALQEDVLLAHLAAAMRRGQLRAIMGGGEGEGGEGQQVVVNEDCLVRCGPVSAFSYLEISRLSRWLHETGILQATLHATSVKAACGLMTWSHPGNRPLPLSECWLGLRGC